MEQEIRGVPTNLEVVERDNSSGKPKQIQGYAITFNQQSELIDGQFTEIIKPTALKGVDLSKVQLIYGHNHNSILARADSGNLTLKVDDSGLFFVATLADTTIANNVYSDILAGNLKGMSFGFTIPRGGDSWQRSANGIVHVVNQIGVLGELTVTPNPAFSATTVQIKRSLDQIKNNEREIPTLAEEDKKPEVDAPDNATQAQPDESTDTEQETPTISNDELLKQIMQLQAIISDMQANSGDESEEDDSEDTPDEDEAEQERDDSDTPDDVEERASQPEQPTQETKTDKEDKTNMPQVAKNEQVNERSNFHNFLKRDLTSITDGTVASDNSVALPNDILQPIEKPANTNSLIALANVTSVNAPSGDIPVLGATNVTLNTTEELQANPQLAKMQLETVSYKLSVKRGFLPVSMELLNHADTAVGIDSLIGDYASQIRDNTLVAGIASVLKQADKVTAKSFDDVKVAYNGLFKYNNKSFVATKSAFDVLDTLKDSQGRYLLTDSISSPSGKQVLGAPVYVVEDTVLGAKDGDAVMFVGDVKSFGIFPTYKDLRVKWTDSDIYGQKLQLVLENDNVVAQKEAGKIVALNFTAPAAGNQG
ncbi:phage major capsid protein [Leuconostoc mesenteroides]|uniref:phage major capsid protein n=1 Tax=Leuconostoc mesenteroides TaxID=1245 RepID=UPI002073A4D2|nr:phage major capsid protein [Leuconostoc mesenteroides]MCM6836084.1 phage major capsid protein [Leuconostoc mesenteroides]